MKRSVVPQTFFRKLIFSRLGSGSGFYFEFQYQNYILYIEDTHNFFFFFWFANSLKNWMRVKF